jgi:hypothetical protein
MRDRSGASASAALALACERMLARSARAHGSGTRQQARAAARRFVRRHRCDEAYLRWVVRSVGAGSALAAALLGLGAAPALAELPPFRALTGSVNPMSGDLVGANSAPAFGDLDGDGDLDVVAGEYNGTFHYFEKLSTYVERTGAANPLNGRDVGIFSTPALADLDRDGDLDLVSGENYGAFFYFENTGTATAPAFLPRTGAANPMNGHDLGYSSTPSLGDLDGDGDLDLFSGEFDAGVFNYFENTGSAKVPAFVARTGAANPMNGQSVGYQSAPTLGDLDGDGDLDLVSGQGFGTFFTWENTGNAKSPAFAPRTGNANPLRDQDIGDVPSAPALGDFDRDGDLDVIAGDGYGAFSAFEHAGSRFARAVPNPLIGLPGVVAPTVGDLDGDGDRDYLLGRGDGKLIYFENVGTAASPTYQVRSGASNPFNAFDVGDEARPAFADLDSDGDFDLIVGTYYGTFHTFVNTGGATSPAFLPIPGGLDPLVGQDVGFLAAPAVGDLDGDGDLDLVAGEESGVLNYFRNDGGPGFPTFVLLPDSHASNPLPLFDVGFDSVPALGDLDRDGDLDLVTGSEAGGFLTARNVGSATDPSFVFVSPDPLAGEDVGSAAAPSFGDLDGDGDLDLAVGSGDGAVIDLASFVIQVPLTAVALTGAANPLSGKDVGALSAPTLADLDADGDVDLLAGESFGTFLYYANTGSRISPRFLLRTGAANPLNGRDVGDIAKPALADLDRDGDLDLLSGNVSGNFDYFQNTGSASGPAFAGAVSNPFGLSGVGSDGSSPSFGDVDLDGDLDLVVGQYTGFSFFQNTGTATNPSFVLRTGSLNPLTGETLTYASPTLGDFDRDGDLDAYSGAAGGRFTYYLNRAAVGLVAIFVKPLASANPLAGTDLGSDSAPAAADLDGDGDPDLVSGSFAGTFAVHYFPEPARGGLLVAGLALLGWLGRLRRRQPLD